MMTHSLKVVLALATCLSLSGCFAARQQAANKVYTQGPPLEVRQDQQSWTIGQNVLNAKPEHAELVLAQIGDDYTRRGLGPMLLVATAPNLAQAETWGATLRERLVSIGVPLNSITLATQLNGPPGASVSYQAATVVVPPCGETPFSPGTYTGCAIGHQIGQMVARPKDLYGNEGVAPYDATSASGAITRQLRNRELARDEGLIDYLNSLTVIQN